VLRSKPAKFRTRHPEQSLPNRGQTREALACGVSLRQGHVVSRSLAMPNRITVDQASLTDNDVAQQVEFTAEIDGDERDFAVKYAVLRELSGDEPENDALELFERFSDEILDVCADVADQRPNANVVMIDDDDLE
jgi:hypothetical protein